MSMHALRLEVKKFCEEHRTSIEEIYLAQCLNDFLCDEQLKVEPEQFDELYDIFYDYVIDCNFGIDYIFSVLRDELCNDCTFDPDYVIQHPENFTGALDKCLQD